MSRVLTLKQKEVLKFIRTRIKGEKFLIEWFEGILRKSKWIFYNEMPKEMKARYIGKNSIGKDVTEFRGCCFSIPKIWYKIETWAYKQYIDKIDGEKFQFNGIVLNNNNETLESNAWLLLHELGHAYMNENSWHTKPLYIIRLLNWYQERDIERKQNLEKGGYWDLYNKDEYHEKRPEEIFCNTIANIIIGKELDRYWWRKNCYIKKESD